jgi:hypothetical protein
MARLLLRCRLARKLKLWILIRLSSDSGSLRRFMTRLVYVGLVAGLGGGQDRADELAVEERWSGGSGGAFAYEAGEG